MKSKDWAHKMLDDITPGWYGEITFTIRAGEIRAVAKTQTFIAPDMPTQSQKVSREPLKLPDPRLIKKDA